MGGTEPGSERVAHSFCRVCAAACGILVHVREVDGDERVTKVTGDPDHPISRGYTCSKGRSIPSQHHHPDRLDHPQLHGAIATWEATLDDLAGRLRGIVDAVGPDAVAIYRSGGWAFDANGRYFIDSFGRALGTRSMFSSVTLDTPAKLLTADLVAGSPYLMPFPDVEQMELLVLIGQNPVVSHGHGIAWPTALADIRAMRARGGSLVVVDPRTTESATHADLHLAPRPGTDAALLAFAVREALTTRPDRDYLADCVDPRSLERLRDAVAPFDRNRAAEICDVPADALDRLAALVTGTRRVAALCGTGTSMGPTPNVSEWLAWALNIVTGSLDRAGGIVFNPGFLRPQEHGTTRRDRRTGPAPTTRPELHHQFGELPSVVLADEILAGNISALVVVGGNPARVFPDSARIGRALDALDVLAVCEVRRTETTAVATHVLPGTGPLERADMPAFVDTTFPRPFGQFSAAAVRPVAERRHTWWIMHELGVRLGLSMPRIPGEEIGRAGAADVELLAQAARRSRVPFEELRGHPSGLLADDAPEPGWLVPAGLPDGALDAAPIELVGQLAAFDRACADVSRAHRVDDPATGEPDPSGLRLITRRLPHLMNSVLREVNAGRPGSQPTLLVNPVDAERLGLVDGATVTVSSAHGSTDAVVERSPTVRDGVVSLPHGFGTPDANGLTSDRVDVDPLTGMPRFTALPVHIAVAG